MTTSTATVPAFRTAPHRSLGAVVALVLSAALAVGFVGSYWHAPAPASQTERA
jgi:hypothetical protein